MWALSFESCVFCDLRNPSPALPSRERGPHVRVYNYIPLPLRGGRVGFVFLLFLDPLIFLYRLGSDGRGRLVLDRVVLLNVSCGSGDSPPCLATTDADGYGGECDSAKQNNCQ